MHFAGSIIVPESVEYARICGPIDAFHGPVSTVDDVVDLWATQGNPQIDGATYQGHERPCRLDYVFATSELADRLHRIWVEHTAAGSDHKPVWTELSLAQ